MKPLLAGFRWRDSLFLVWCCINFQIYREGQPHETLSFPLSVLDAMSVHGKLLLGLIALLLLAAIGLTVVILRVWRRAAAEH